MNRREFLKLFGVAAVSAVAAPLISKLDLDKKVVADYRDKEIIVQ